MPIGGGEVLTIASDQKRPTGIAIDGESVYWTNPSRSGQGSFPKTSPDYSATVVKAPLRGGTPKVLATEQPDPQAIAVDRANVYWTNLSLANRAAGSVMKIALSGGTATTLASRQTMPLGIVVTSTDVLWTSDGQLRRIPIEGGTLTSISPPDQFVGGEIATDGTSVYCFATPHSAPPPPARGSSPDTRVLKIPLDGSAPTVLASGLYSPHGIAIDRTSVYWIDSSVMKVRVTGGAAETIGGENDVIASIAVDATSVYWAALGGEIRKLTPK